MEIVIMSLAAILGAVLVNVIVVPQILRAIAGAGAVMSGGGDSGGGAIPAFVGMLVLLTGWAYLCFTAADWLAGEEMGQRWVLLIAAAGLAGGPYLLYQRRVANLGIAHRLIPPIHAALEYAGGIQSKLVLAAMVSGIWFDWWEHLPG